MNRLKKTDGRRGKGAPRTHSSSVRAAGTCASNAGAAATRARAGATGVPQDAARVQAGATGVPQDAARAQAGATGVPQDVGVPRSGAFPIGGWWPMSPPSSEGLYPPGGFSNFLQSNPFVGAGLSQSSVSSIDMGATRTSMGDTRTPSPAQQTVDIVDDIDEEEDAEEDETINIDETSRTANRLNWTVPEDERLASAWLRNSKDPVDGNDKKSDAYWTDVTKEYNKTTKNSRKRNRNQLKIRWDRNKKPLMDFHGCWVNASRVWESGMSDDQVTSKALEMWSGKNKDKPFHLLHMWKVVRGSQKWSAYLAKKKKEKEKGAKVGVAQIVNLELDGEKRPIGHKKAKKELNGKKKSSDALLADFSGKIEKFIEASTKNREDREKMTEIQKSLADKNIESARLNHATAQEQTRCKMLETYTQLLLAPTDQLSENALAERNLALESLRLALFPKN